MGTQDDTSAGQQRDTGKWTTDDEPMTAAQRSYLETLCRTFDENLTRAEASKLIDELSSRPRS